jgi:hypothetical protein
MLEKWLNEYGEITSFSFIMYSYYGVRDNAIINAGLTYTISNSEKCNSRYYQSISDINEEDAKLWNVNRGLNVQWVFPNRITDGCEKMIITTIKEGLESLNIANDLIGVYGSVN